MKIKSLLNFGASLMLVVLAVSLTLVECKPTADTSIKPDKRQDPMMALPSEHHHLSQQIAYTPQPPQQVHYIIQNEPGQATQTRQEVSYVLVNSESGQPADTPVEEDRSRGDARAATEYVVAPNSEQVPTGLHRDYPGEIVYVSQSGQELPAPSSHEQESLAGAVAQSSGVPATILTEVPIKDLPYEVLEKLKRDFGVKVVATRERPGANLVINCDDYTGQGQTICSRQQVPANQAAVGGPFAAGYVAAEEQPTHLVARDQVEPATGGLEHTAEPQQGTYITRDGQTRVVGAPHPHEEAHERFGSRTYATLAEQTEPAQPAAPEEVAANSQASGEADSVLERQVQPQPESETHDSGFEHQPEKSVEEYTTDANNAEELSGKSSR